MNRVLSQSTVVLTQKKIRRGVSCAACRKKKVVRTEISFVRVGSFKLLYRLRVQACDAAKPACGNCLRIGVHSQCFYPGIKKTPRLPLWGDRIRELEHEIAILEAADQARKRLSASDAESWFWGVLDHRSPHFLSACGKVAAQNSLSPRTHAFSSGDWWATGDNPPHDLCTIL